MMLLPTSVPLASLCFALLASALPELKTRDDISPSGQAAVFNSKVGLASSIANAMLGSIRTSWEQGTAAAGLLEIENPEYSIFADSPFTNNGNLPARTLALAFSAAVRQSPDGRLSQQINEATDGAALDGASAGPYVLLGTFTGTTHVDFLREAAEKQLDYLLNTAPRTSNGAISMRDDERAYWNDGVFMGPPFLAYYGALNDDAELLQLAFDNIRLYREILIRDDGPTGSLWAHIYNEEDASFWDRGLWATGNAWAALGIIRVQETIKKSSLGGQFQDQINTLQSWVKEILDGTFAAIRSEDDLIPNYIDSNDTFGDAASSAALASVAFRAAVIDPDTFGSNYTEIAGRIAKAVLSGVDEIGVIQPYADPLSWSKIGPLSTEGQAFALMMVSAWRAWLKSSGQSLTA